MKTCEQMICHPRAFDLAGFEKLALAAKDAGFTHLVISDLCERTDYRGDNAESPWCEWSIEWPSFFKHAQPDGLEDAFPKEFVSRQMEYMKAKHAIVAKLGLKAAYFSLEPHWLSERVYAKHPEWRGSRCDNSLRTSGMYFAPNVYHPEVQERYRHALREIVAACPRIDTFLVFTNDSGSGFPWAARLYVNVNGPTGSKNRDIGYGVRDFARVIRQGAQDSGVTARVFMSTSHYMPDEVHLIKRSLEPGIGVIGMAPGDLVGECSLAVCASWATSNLTHDSWSPFAVVSDAATARTTPARRFHLDTGVVEQISAFKVAMSAPPATSERQKLDALTRVAASVYAEDVADSVVDAWYAVENANNQINTARVPHWGLTALRWLIRPMVPFQSLLTEEERSYWEPYIYQSKSSQPETYLDYLNTTGGPIVSTWNESTWICVAIDRIDATLRSAAGMLEAASSKTRSEEAARKLKRDAARVRARACMSLTCRHFLQMGTLIYERERDGLKTVSVDPHVPMPDPRETISGSSGLFYMYRAMRWELDNIHELIRIVESSSEPIVRTAPDNSRQGPLILGPDFLEGMKKKAAIMLKYWRTAENGYYRPTRGG